MKKWQRRHHHHHRVHEPVIGDPAETVTVTILKSLWRKFLSWCWRENEERKK